MSAKRTIIGLAIALVAALVALVAVLLAGNGDTTDVVGDGTASTSTTSTAVESTSTTSTTSTSSTSTSSTTTTTSTSTTTTAAPSGACAGSGALPAGAENQNLAAGDVDGNGVIDTIMSYTLGDPSTIGAWWLQVSFGDGGSATLQIVDPDANLSGVRPYDGVDLDGDGTDEFFAKVGAGASVSILGAYHVSECKISPIIVDGGESRFPVGASIGFVSGLECHDSDTDGALDELVVYNGQVMEPATDGEYEVTASHYEYASGVFTFGFADGGGGNVADPGFKYGSLTCPGLPTSP